MAGARVKASFWSGKKVFVTGHTGFMGGWLTLALARMGARVSGYALTPPTEPNLFTAGRVDAACRTTIGDVRDLDSLAGAVAACEPDVVFHLAAQPLVRYAFANPVETYGTNVMGTVNLIEAVRRVRSPAAIVAVTTDKVYENREWTWGYRETDVIGGREPYGNSKACAEFVVDAYRRSYFTDGRTGIATVRAGNIIGGGDWALDRLVPDAVRAFADGKSLRIRNPNAVRPFQHVLDPVRGMIMLAERLAHSPDSFTGGWNFGPAESDTRSAAWIADRCARLWGPTARWQSEAVANAPHEAHLLVLSSAQAHTRLGWTPTWDSDAATVRAVNWYRAYYDRADVAALTQSQINEHEAANASAVEIRHDRSASPAA
ncbi:MAG TPA: CDP-glucose 4,6-dehydratase [Alphaproteobacteria bacterium]|jgi:CDP-glucose 4,6-dehydratase|nr:CDP-glucose 4,6-dehydratase [Alphaproteobacteria bacterium]